MISVTFAAYPAAPRAKIAGKWISWNLVLQNGQDTYNIGLHLNLCIDDLIEELQIPISF